MVTRSFLTAGRAIFTVEPPPGLVSQGCRAHYTFQIRRKEASGRWREPAWFASLLTGPENTRDFTYLGKLNTETGEVHLTQASRFNDHTWPVYILRRVLDRIWRGEGTVIEQTGWKVYHSGHCGRCGRVLTVPSSIQSGIGPECATRLET
jgi:hypothetical protein